MACGFTVREVRDEVKRLMGMLGLDPALFGAHSLRIGGATAALAAGVSPQLIRLMGRWSSDVYELYCRMSLQSAVSVGRAISSAVVTPTWGSSFMTSTWSCCLPRGDGLRDDDGGRG